MAQSLQSFHFNPIKLGQILRQLAKERDISQSKMASETGLSYDTIGNVYSGKIVKTPFEYVFKICIVLGLPFEAIMVIMLKQEDIDFRDRVLLYDTYKDDAVPVADVLPSMAPSPFSDEVVETAIVQAENTSAPVDIPFGYYTKEEVKDMIADATRQKEIEISYLKLICEKHDAHINDLKEQHRNERNTGDKYRALLQHALGMKTTD